ncbi:type IV pilus modification protein PilV [Pseudomonas sp. NPDC078700]|uniref:type IV pilus modification protein PilV n=1 Tax=Pseudomonas sp. NPDC078700 TaxID=3364424 RepID=UPI0037CADCE1
MSKKISGFSLIEVLVTLVLITIGVLGMVAMQSKAIQYAQDSAQRDTAAMLVDDLIEQMRSNREALLDSQGIIATTSNYFKAANSAFPTNAVATCRAAAGCTKEEMATDQLVLWSRQISNSLPIDAALLSSGFVICRDSTPDTDACDSSGTAIKIQVAWYSREDSTCPAGTPCEVGSNRQEFYRISFEP